MLLRLSTYAPAHAVTAAARGETPGPGRSRLEGAVLVADLSGFTSLSETLGRQGRDGIDELTTILNQVFSTLLERAVFPWGGALVKYAGDALLCYFDGEEPVPRAVAAGLAAQAYMEELSTKLVRKLAVRVGVGAGRFDLVTVGRLGERLDCFCAGDAAMLALVAVDDAGPRALILEGQGLPRGPFHSGSDIAQRLAGHPLKPQARPNSLAGVEKFDVRTAVERLRPFVPPEVFERIGENPNAPLRAERRDACAVFCEIEGWDGDVSALGDHYLTAWECARKHGGMLNKIDALPRGPRMLAAFGVAGAKGDDERRALAFAVEVRDRLLGRVRVGLEAGPLFAGEVGSALKHEFTVMGDTVNIAARLAHSASPAQILCGPDLWSRVDSFVGRPTAPLPLKGKSLPLTPIDVAAPRRFTATSMIRRVGHPHLFGREAELAQIVRISERAIAGHLQTALLLGPPGIGKSALAGAAADRWIDAGGVAFSLRCEYGKRDQPYLLVRALVGAWLSLKLDPVPPFADILEALDRLGIGDPVLAEQIAWLLDPGSPRGDPQNEASVARAVSERMVRTLAASAPVLLVIEDADHADAGSSSLVQYARGLPGPLRCLMLVVRRQGGDAEAARGRFHHILQVGPLARDASRALLARSLSAPDVSPVLEDAVEARARGNPLFIKRLAGWMSSQGMIVRAGDRAALTPQASEEAALSLPPDLESLVNAEVDRLSAAPREVLRTVAVLGGEFASELAMSLCASAGLSPAEVHAALVQLSRSGLLMGSGGATPSWRFARLSDREVVYAGLPAAERKALHARVAAVLAARGLGDDQLALHYDLADDHPKAARSCLEVARAAQRRGSFGDALRLYKAAARHFAALGQSRTECALGELECLSRLSSYGEARKLALQLAGELPDPVARLRALTSAAMCASYQGDLAAARQLMAQAKAAIPADAPVEMRVNLLLMCASYHAAVGSPQEALEELAEARPLAAEDRAPVIVGLQAGLLAETGRAQEAVPLAEAAVRFADQGAHKPNRAFTRVSLARSLEAQGDREAAIARYREAQALYSEAGQLANASNARLHAAQVELEIGRARTALPELIGALSTFRHFASGQDETAARCAIGRARLLLGEREAGIAELEDAVRLSDRTREQHAAVCGRAWLAEALWSEDPGRARALLEEAFRVGRERQATLDLAEARAVARRIGAG
jgi:class 3 adenylate cyclase/tetratricopeptide (TPR) repeat protein